jgi:hypothetical protein
MKAQLQKFISTAVLGLALCSQTLPAWAGLAITSEVFIHGDSAQGALAGARYSVDGKQFIGCSAESFSNQPTLVECSAGDKNGRFVYCTSIDARMADAVKGMTDSSHIYFTVDRVTRLCTNLEITNESSYLK